mmetsp:Transcript_15519/g.39084  ORF Transcript_15519/g.39084 Transcript_15519/m.39084 type:complete len:351 (-) Transcript_15519:168-1220(-)
MMGRRVGRGNQFLALMLLGMLALLSIAIGSLSFVEADGNVSDKATTEGEEEGVCTWDGEAGKKKCDGQQSEEEEEEEEEDDEVWDEIEDDDEFEGWDEEEIEEYFRMMRKFVEIPEEGEEWDVWKHGRKGALYEELGCDNEMDDSTFQNIHTAETWQTFNRIYNEVIASTQGDEKLQQKSTIPAKFEKNGFQFPVEVKFELPAGRGVFAKAYIPKGSLLYTSENNAAFMNGQTFRNYLKALPRELACDVMIWSFVRWVDMESEFNDKHMACVDLDEGSFVNTVNDESDYNMALGDDDGNFYNSLPQEQQWDLWPGCKMKFYAAQGIKAGEEILAEYGDFAETEGWKYLKL